MKKAAIVLATVSMLISCKKEKQSPTSNSSSSTTQVSSISVEFFVDASKYQVREPIDYPFGSPMFTDASNPFTALASGNACSVTGKKINVKYSSSDTTTITLWFFKSGSPTDIMKGTCNLKITPGGALSMTYANAPGSGITPYMAGCKKAIIFQ